MTTDGATVAAPEAGLSHRQIQIVFVGLMLGMLLAALDQTIVATALSSVAADLGGWQALPWVVSAYLIASTVVTPIYGRLSDLYGRRPLLLASVAIFIAGEHLEPARWIGYIIIWVAVVVFVTDIVLRHGRNRRRRRAERLTGHGG